MAKINCHLVLNSFRGLPVILLKDEKTSSSGVVKNLNNENDKAPRMKARIYFVGKFNKNEAEQNTVTAKIIPIKLFANVLVFVKLSAS